MPSSTGSDATRRSCSRITVSPRTTSPPSPPADVAAPASRPAARRVAGTDIANWWDNGANAIAFSRGTKGFVAINRETTTITQTVSTPLAPGSYCDLITGGKVGTTCAGTELTVTAQGTIALSLAANTAVAIDLSTKR